MGSKEMTVYSNAGFRVVTLICGIAVRGRDGVILDRYGAGEIEQAVETADHMAQMQGCYASVSAGD
jgi:hypothetical protein